jgi:hypothetical protein
MTPGFEAFCQVLYNSLIFFLLLFLMGKKSNKRTHPVLRFSLPRWFVGAAAKTRFAQTVCRLLP